MEKKSITGAKSPKPTLANHPFLRGLKREHIDLLARHATIVNFAAGEVIFRQNEFADRFFFVLEGKVGVETYVPRSENVPVQVVGKGDVLGWSWLFAPFTWHFQARAIEPTKAICLNAASALIACEKDHGLGFELMERVAQVVIARLKETQNVLLASARSVDSLRPIDDTAFHCPVVPLTSAGVETMISEHPFSKGMKKEHLKILARAAMAKDFQTGETVFRDGDLANRFYLIHRGRIVIESANPDGTPIPIEVLGDGDVVGWSWLFPPYHWHFDARVLEPTSAIFVFGTRVREEAGRDHDFGYELMKRVCRLLIERLQATRKQVTALHERQPIVALVRRPSNALRKVSV